MYLWQDVKNMRGRGIWSVVCSSLPFGIITFSFVIVCCCLLSFYLLETIKTVNNRVLFVITHCKIN